MQPALCGIVGVRFAGVHSCLTDIHHSRAHREISCKAESQSRRPAWASVQGSHRDIASVFSSASALRDLTSCGESFSLAFTSTAVVADNKIYLEPRGRSPITQGFIRDIDSVTYKLMHQTGLKSLTEFRGTGQETPSVLRMREVFPVYRGPRGYYHRPCRWLQPAATNVSLQCNRYSYRKASIGSRREAL